MADETSAPEIISLQEAKAKGLLHYFTGVPCRRGHVALRETKSAACKACRLLNGRARRAANPERFRERDRRQKAKDREKLRERDRQRYWRDPDKQRQRVRDYYSRNTELVKERARSATRERRLENGPKYQEYAIKNLQRSREWAKKHPDIVRVRVRNAKARRRNAPGAHTVDDVLDIEKMQKGRCAYCRVLLKKKYHVDHIVALARGGSNDRSNLQLLCAPCNLRKGALDQGEVMRSLGRLL